MFIDLFAGAGGWDVGLTRAGVQEEILGIDNMPAACETGKAAGFSRLLADLRDVSPKNYSNVKVIVGSPPCQSFSASGNGRGFDDERGQLTRIPYLWASELQPDYFLLEQVPGVAPYWRQTAKKLRDELGYYTKVKIVESASFNVPQSRLRAVLLAAKHPFNFEEPDDYTVLREVFPEHVGYRMISVANGSKKDATGRRCRGERTFNQPAFTLTGKCLSDRFKPPNQEARPATIEELSLIQSFPANYPWRGGRRDIGQQIGNAIPPNLAAALFKAVTKEIEV